MLQIQALSEHDSSTNFGHTGSNRALLVELSLRSPISRAIAVRPDSLSCPARNISMASAFSSVSDISSTERALPSEGRRNRTVSSVDAFCGQKRRRRLRKHFCNAGMPDEQHGPEFLSRSSPSRAHERCDGRAPHRAPGLRHSLRGQSCVRASGCTHRRRTRCYRPRSPSGSRSGRAVRLIREKARLRGHDPRNRCSRTRPPIRNEPRRSPKERLCRARNQSMQAAASAVGYAKSACRRENQHFLRCSYLDTAQAVVSIAATLDHVELRSPRRHPLMHVATLSLVAQSRDAIPCAAQTAHRLGSQGRYGRRGNP